MARNWSDVFRVNNIILVGVLHYRVEFSVQVNRLVRNERPDCICVELPRAIHKEITIAIRKLPHHWAIVYETAAGENSVLIVEGSDGIQEAARLALEKDIPLRFVDPLPHRYPLFTDSLPDAYLIDVMGQRTFLQTIYMKQIQQADADNSRRETFMAAAIQEASRTYGKVLFVGGLAHIPGLVSLLDTPQALPLLNTGVKAAVSAPVHPDSLKKGFTEIPKVTEAFEKWRQNPENPAPVNRHEMIVSLMAESANYFSRQTHQEVPEYVRSTWAKFLRKWLTLKGRLLPDLYHLVSAARSAMDEDFAYHVHEFLSDYEWANDPSDPANVLLDEDNLMFHGHKIVLHKKLRTLFQTTRKYRMKAVSSSKWKEHLKRKWETADPGEVDICSYPPEDVEVEQWGDTLMRHANHLLLTAQTGSKPFIADFGGGPDVRETLRRFYEKRVYVKTDEEGGIDFGSVVVIFEEDEHTVKYPYQMTWLGEHSQESDMAFYSTLPGVELVGPGISRMEHGGFMMSYPPMRMFDIWLDHDFDFVPTRHERLLVAGIAYSEKPGIVYSAKRPPAQRWKKLAKSMGKRIMYVPLGSLNPIHVKRMRSFHMLQNKGIRNIAHEFLKKD